MHHQLLEGKHPLVTTGYMVLPYMSVGLPYRTSLLCTPRLQVLGGPSAHLSGLMSVSQKFAAKQLSRVIAWMDRGRQEGEGGRSHSPTAAELGWISGPRTGSLGLCPACPHPAPSRPGSVYAPPLPSVLLASFGMTVSCLLSVLIHVSGDPISSSDHWLRRPPLAQGLVREIWAKLAAEVTS